MPAQQSESCFTVVLKHAEQFRACSLHLTEQTD